MLLGQLGYQAGWGYPPVIPYQPGTGILLGIAEGGTEGIPVTQPRARTTTLTRAGIFIPSRVPSLILGSLIVLGVAQVVILIQSSGLTVILPEGQVMLVTLG